MKQTLLIIALFIGFENVYAQSDATVKETVNWINEHALSKQLIQKSYILTSIALNEDEKEITYWREYKGEEIDPVVKLFTKHEKLEVGYSDSGYYYVKIQHLNKYAHYIRFENKSMAQRTYNAFDHLFKLLNIEVTKVSRLVDENKF